MHLHAGIGAVHNSARQLATEKYAHSVDTLRVHILKNDMHKTAISYGNMLAKRVHGMYKICTLERRSYEKAYEYSCKLCSIYKQWGLTK